MGEAPITIPGNPPPAPPKDWEKKWKFQDLLNRQNPMMSLTYAQQLKYTRKDQNDTKKDEKDDAADVAKKKARVAAIIAANRAKRKGLGKTSNVSGTGVITPMLYSYPSSGAEQTTGAGFSWSDIPSIVWIILAVAGGIFFIKSAGKGKR